ncbi:MAG: hypothetical protein ACKO4R_07855 [Synechococcales cyanobacterium]
MVVILAILDYRLALAVGTVHTFLLDSPSLFYISLLKCPVPAVVLYYLHHKQEISEYPTNWLELGHKMKEVQKLNSPPVSEKLR